MHLKIMRIRLFNLLVKVNETSIFFLFNCIKPPRTSMHINVKFKIKLIIYLIITDLGTPINLS